MSDGRLLENARRIVELEHRLSRCPQVVRYSSGEHDEAATLAHALADLEESFDEFRRTLLPRLLAPPESADRDYEVLLDIGEELRHILYHINDARFYRYLQSDVAEEPET